MCAGVLYKTLFKWDFLFFLTNLFAIVLCVGGGFFFLSFPLGVYWAHSLFPCVHTSGLTWIGGSPLVRLLVLHGPVPFCIRALQLHSIIRDITNLFLRILSFCFYKPFQWNAHGKYSSERTQTAELNVQAETKGYCHCLKAVYIALFYMRGLSIGSYVSFVHHNMGIS